jgi:hypothetical protein
LQISKKWKKIKLFKDADLVHQNSHVRRLNRLKAVAAHPSADGMSLMMMVVVRLFSTIHSTVTTIQLHRKKV